MPELMQPNIVGNFLSSYADAQAMQQQKMDRERQAMRQDRADQMAEKEFTVNMDSSQLNMALKRADALNGILSQVNPADPMSLEKAKSDFVGMFGGDPQMVAGVTMDRVKELRAETDLKRNLLRSQIAAANRSNRPQPSSGRGGLGPTAIDPATGQPIASDGLANVKLTEQQSKDIGFLRRAQEANTQLDDKKIAGLTNTKDAIARSVPVVGRALQSEQSRQGVQVGKNFLAAVLRKDTGAAVTDTEFDYYSDIFLPQWGDDDGTLQLKSRARSAFLEGLRAGMSNGASLAQMGIIPPPDLAPRGDETAPPPASGQGQPASATGAPSASQDVVYDYDENGNRRR